MNCTKSWFQSLRIFKVSEVQRSYQIHFLGLSTSRSYQPITHSPHPNVQLSPKCRLSGNNGELVLQSWRLLLCKPFVSYNGVEDISVFVWKLLQEQISLRSFSFDLSFVVAKEEWILIRVNGWKCYCRIHKSSQLCFVDEAFSLSVMISFCDKWSSGQTVEVKIIARLSISPQMILFISHITHAIQAQ